MRKRQQAKGLLRKSQQEARRQREQLLAAITDHLPGCVYRGVWHGDGTVTLPLISGGFRELTGIEPQQAIANPEILARMIHPDDWLHFEEVVRTSWENLPTYHQEFRIRATSGSWKWVQNIGRLSRTENGDVIVDGVLLEISPEQNCTLRPDCKSARFFSLSLDLLAIANLDGYFIELNPAWEKILGFPLEELKTRPLIELIAPADVTATQAEFEKLRAGIPITNFENRYRCQDGSYKWLSWTGVPFLEEGLIYAVARDLGAYKQIEAAWSRANQELEIQVAERTAHLRQVNEELVAEIVERRQVEISLERLNQELEERVQQRTAQLEQALEQLQGEVRERQQTEEALRASEARLRLALEAAKMFCWDWDLKNHQVSYSGKLPTAPGGVAAGQISDAEFLAFVHPDDWEALHLAQQKAIESLGELQIEHRAIAPGQQLLWLLVKGKVFTDETGKGTHLLGISVDITQRKRAEAALWQQMERERLLGITLDQIRRSLELDEILATTVTQVRQLLGAERVLIFRLCPDGTAIVVAESVVPEWPKMLDMIFPEEILPAAYYEFYCQGEPRVVADVGQDEWAGCLVEFLQQMGVKSKVVVPILQELGKTGQSSEIETIFPDSPHPTRLWGLLIAHACANYREWQPVEVELLNSLGNQLAIAILQANLYSRVQLELNRSQQTAQKLRHSEARLAEAQKLTHVGSWEFDLATQTIKGSAELFRIFGLHPTPPELTYREFLQRIYPDDRTWWSKKVKQVIRQKICYEFDHQILRPDGSLRYASTRGQGIFDEQGQAIQLFGTIQDITERKQVEAALRKARDQLEIRVQERTAELTQMNESLQMEICDRQRIAAALDLNAERFRVALKNTSITVFNQDKDLRYTWIYNPTFGLDDTAIIGKLDSELIPPESAQRITDIKRRVLTTGIGTREETFIQINPRETFYYNLTVEPLWNQAGEIIGITGAATDITNIRAREKQLQAIFESTQEAILIADDDGRYIEANPAACQEFGLPLSELLGKRISNFTEPGFDFELAWRTFKQQGQSTGEFRLLRPDGTRRDVEFAAIANFLPGRHLSVLRDTTLRKQAEEIHLALQKEKELSQLQRRFFSMVSHEFRTPISTILLSAQSLENSHNRWSSEKILKNLRRIQASAKHTIQLLEDILTINRAETGKLEFNPKRIYLERFCRHLVEDMQLIAGNTCQITFVSQGEVKEADMDEKLLHSILDNLLSNAIKYSGEGGHINFSLICYQEEVIFQICDEGIGIPLEDIPHLFNPFYRGTNVGSIPGTGLGITVVKKCLDLHRGKIALQSKVGVGTTVTVTIPRTSS